MNHSLQLNNPQIACNNELLTATLMINTKIVLTIVQNMFLLCVPFLVFVLFFLALVIVSLFKLEKIIRFKSYHTVLKVVLRGLKFFLSSTG